MNRNEQRACAGTAIVTLLAIAGFCCTVFTPPIETSADGRSLQTLATLDIVAAPAKGDLQ